MSKPLTPAQLSAESRSRRAADSQPAVLTAAPEGLRDALIALEGAAEWLRGWASAEPYLSTIEKAIDNARASLGLHAGASGMSTDLKPCPFCGHQPEALLFGEGSTFRWLEWCCPGCGIGSEERVQTMGEGTPAEWLAQAKLAAIATWNTRAAASMAPPATTGLEPGEGA